MNQDTASVVFLSHNSSDKRAVEELAHRLLACTPSIRPWLDKDDLRAHGTWVEQIEEVIASCEAAAVFYGPGGPGRIHEIERQLLIDRATRQPDTFRLIPVLLPGSSPAQVTGFAKLHNWVDFTAGLDSPAAFDRLVAFLRGEAPRSTTADDEIAPGFEPYRGLERFDGEHAGVFFGRDPEIRELCGRLAAWPFTAVIGGSGSGESSLARAGLETDLAVQEFPRLRGAVRIVVLPGPNPLRALADRVAAAVPRAEGQAPEDLADAFEDRFRVRPDGLLTLLDGRFPDESRTVLLVVDQFEELFTHCRDEPGGPGRCRGQAEQFVRLLDAVAGSGRDRFRVLVTLRADFFDRCLQVPPLVPLVSNHQVLLGDLSPDALRDVIVEPARQAGAYFEKGVVARILDDVAGQNGSLPLLQQALKELWVRRRGRWLTNDAYDESGGVAGALRQRADETLKGLTPARQEVARNIFLRLTTPGEGVGDTRRRARLDELYPKGGDRSIVDAVIADLSGKDSRLIVVNDDGTAEVTHEALIRSWSQLRKWLDADRDELVLHRRLTVASDDWRRTCPDDPARRDPTELWDGGRLALAEAFRAGHTGALNDLEVEFLDASLAARRRREADKLGFIRRWSYALLTAACVAVVLAVYAFIERNDARSKAGDAEISRRWEKQQREAAEKATLEAQAQARLATSRQLAALAAMEMDQRPDRGLLLAAEATRTAGTEEARRVLLAALRASPHLRRFLHHPAARVSAVAFSPDRQTLVTASPDSTIYLWDISTGRRQDPPLRGRPGTACLAFSPDGKLLASGSSSSRMSLWEVATQRPLGPPFVATGPIHGIAFSPDGTALVSGGQDGAVILWDLDVHSWQSRARDIANRDLTRAEWEQFVGPEIPYRIGDRAGGH